MRADIDRLVYDRPAVAVAAAPMQRQRVVMAAPAPAGELVLTTGSVPYRLDAGDRLRIVVYGQEGLTNSYAVDTTGAITMPLIGSVQARGVSTAELARTIAARLRNGYIREPHVAVEIESYRPFYILGEVTAPGQYPYVPNLTVENAVAIAGGFTPRADRHGIQVARSTPAGTLRQTVPPATPVRPGDTITIGERWF